MLHLITATPGSGKTFWTVSEIIKLAAKGEQIYSNINGLTVPGVDPIPDDYDLEALPDNSYIFIDEAQKIDKFQAVGRQPLSSDPTIKFFETHRHRGFEIYFITQDPEFLHKHILKLIGHHVFLIRPMGSKFPAVYEWSKYQNRPDSKAAQKGADAHYNISFKKSVYQYYTSATVHTHRFQWKQLLKLAWLPIVAIIFITYFFLGTDNKFINTHAFSDAKNLADPNKPQNTNSATGATATGTNTTNSPQIQQQESAYDREAKRVAMISRSDSTCRAYDGNGNLMMNLKYSDCLYFSDNPIAMQKARPDDIRNKQQIQPTNDYSNNAPVPQQTQTNVAGDPLPYAQPVSYKPI